MGSNINMKTTIDLLDALLERAKRVASEEGTTLKALVELGLRRVIDERRPVPPFKLRRASFKGNGLSTELQGSGFDEIRRAAHEGRGG